MLSDVNVGLVTIGDLGDPLDIHPKNKQDVGFRAAICAEGKFYGMDMVYSGPIYKSMSVDGDKVTLSFDFTGSGLMAGTKTGLDPVKEDTSGKLTGFAVAGEDGVYYAADAVINGDTVVVSSSNVANPVSVRYGWYDSPVINLYNKEGLIASPFRTDGE
jgi:sialate O-acetylesterase